jgi:hypothetical protein
VTHTDWKESTRMLLERYRRVRSLIQQV